MGMCLVLHTIDDDSIAKLLGDPPLIWKVIAPDDPEMYASARSEGAGSWFSRLFGSKRQSTEAETIAGFVSEGDLDKAWHAIHYLLTKSAWGGDPPLNFLLLGGTEVGTVDVGYGPARALTSGQVREIHAALLPIDEAGLRSRFDPTEMMALDIYPAIWDREPAEEDTFAYCAEYFGELKFLLAEAEQQRLGLIIHCC